MESSPVGQLLIFEDHRYGVGRPLRLFLEQLVQAAVARIIPRCGVPLHQQLLPLRVAQERQFGNPLVGIGDDPVQEPAVVIRQTLDCSGVEQGGAVEDLSPQPAAAFLQMHFQVEADASAVLGDRAHAYSRQEQVFVRGVLHGEDDLKQRMATEVPLRLQVFHQLLKGQVLMIIGLQRHLPYPRQQVPERRIAREVRG